MNPYADDGRETLRLRDDLVFGTRAIVHIDDLGAILTIADTPENALCVHLDVSDIEQLILVLTEAADRIRYKLCPWCDSVGVVEGASGPESCTHPDS
ncbi:hypothetical protein A7U43_18390 [Mycobacterium adipatum]|uniref:Uncharacterized protein n=1 Tax=Mycobacterium adipatum TaxID=1682113 RepID=A0A172UPS3_9MYCO|nr:hypothetical protein [Mycobacterium adipatum]ANE80996.1 hypothetical protein A7U43_18390 [Mycobacterium adipatum]MBI5739062.1 hypothetical protein [Mycolicibacterium neoaurum]